MMNDRRHRYDEQLREALLCETRKKPKNHKSLDGDVVVFVSHLLLVTCCEKGKNKCKLFLF